MQLQNNYCSALLLALKRLTSHIVQGKGAILDLWSYKVTLCRFLHRSLPLSCFSLPLSLSPPRDIPLSDYCLAFPLRGSYLPRIPTPWSHISPALPCLVTPLASQSAHLQAPQRHLPHTCSVIAGYLRSTRRGCLQAGSACWGYSCTGCNP